MRRVRKYRDFLSEELFWLKKKPIKKDKDKIESCINHILAFLKDNQIEDWNDFETMSPFDRQVVDKLIDSEVDNMEELKEVRFGVKLHLSDRPQLRTMLSEYEEQEEYEKCARILKKINNV